MKNSNIAKVCNSINCFYVNEYMGFDDNNVEYPQECRFCAYDFNKLQVSRKFLRDELENSSKILKNRLKEKIYEFIIKAFAAMSAIIILIYFLSYFKLFSK